MARWLALVLGLALALISLGAGATRAAAQAGTMEDLLAPLVDGAEDALAHGRPSLAAARAQAAIDALAPTSPLAARAQAIVAQAEPLVGAETVDPSDDVMTPLLDAAEGDLAGDERARGEARVAFVLSVADERSSAATRAHALLAPTTPEGAPASTTTAETTTPVAAEPELDESAAVAHEVAPPADPTRRDDAEIIELYITASTFGVYTGFWIPFGAGLQGGNDRNPESLVYSVSVLAGGALFALGVAGLDSGSGMRAGQPAAISASLRYGVALGFMMWGALDPVLSPNDHCDPSGTFTCTENRAGLAERTSLPLAFGAAGGLVGLGVALGLRPTTDQVRSVEMGGLWGGAIGLLSALGAAPDSSSGFAITATSVGLGLLGSAAVAGMGVHLGGRRMGFMTLGLLAGAAVGLLVPAFGAIGAHDWSWPLFSVTGATGLAGLVIAGLVTDGMDEGPSTGPDIHVSVSPTEGGGMASLSGSF